VSAINLEMIMLPYRTARAIRIEDFRVRLEDRPGWVWGTTRVPQKGEEIFCAAGLGTVTAVHGKTGNGSRLVQIGLGEAVKQPFFAAASNVLLAPVETAAPVGASGKKRQGRKTAAGATAGAATEEWLGGSSKAVLLE
jgi:hypothetical protein